MKSQSALNVHVRDIAQVGALLGDPTRVKMLIRLMDGSELPARELANLAGVRASTASEHLARLVESGLLIVTTYGRSRCFSLASADIAHAVEAVAAVAPAMPSSRDRPAGAHPLREARACYDHIAGRLGVSIAQSLIDIGVLSVSGEDFMVTTPIGERWFRDFGIDIDSVRRHPRSFARACLDWTERRHHLAGALGAAVAERCYELQWVKRIADTRAVRVTVDGQRGLRRLLRGAAFTWPQIDPGTTSLSSRRRA